MLYLLGYSGRQPAHLRTIEREVAHRRRQRPAGHRDGVGRGQPGQHGPRAGRCEEEHRRQLDAYVRQQEDHHRRPRCAGDPFTTSALSTEQGRLRAAQDAVDPRTGDGHQLEAPCRLQDALLARPRYNGETYSDRGYQNTWEVSRGQSGTSGILVNYTGGDIGASFGSGTPDSRARQFLAQIEPVCGCQRELQRQGVHRLLDREQWSKGSYSYWKVGQYTAFSGIEGVEQAGCHFAGEQTSVDNQGYLEAASSPAHGRRARSSLPSSS